MSKCCHGSTPERLHYCLIVSGDVVGTTEVVNVHQLSISLDGAETTSSQLPRYSPSALLRGTVSLTPDSDTHLNSITILLGWSVGRLQEFKAGGKDGSRLELLDHGLLGYGAPRAVKPNDRALHGLKFGKGSVKTVDSRNITGKSDPEFPDALEPHKTYDWRFTFPIPQEPWSYMGGLFRIQWHVEARADVGRGRFRIPLLTQRPHALVKFDVTPHVS